MHICVCVGQSCFYVKPFFLLLLVRDTRLICNSTSPLIRHATTALLPLLPLLPLQQHQQRPPTMMVVTEEEPSAAEAAEEPSEVLTYVMEETKATTCVNFVMILYVVANPGTCLTTERLRQKMRHRWKQRIK